MTFAGFKINIYIRRKYGGVTMSKKKKKPLMAMVSSAYFKIYTKNFLTFRKGAIGKSRYACRKYPGYVSVFGWEGDKDAPIAFIDGSYLLRDRKIHS